MKNQYIGGNYLKRGRLGQFADLRGRLAKEEGGSIFEGLIPQCTLCPKLDKKVIMSLDLSKVSGPDCIPVVFWYRTVSWNFHTY